MRDMLSQDSVFQTFCAAGINPAPVELRSPLLEAEPESGRPQ